MQLVLKFNETVITVLKKKAIIKLLLINSFINIILIRVDTMYTCKQEDRIMHKPQRKYDKHVHAHVHVITHLNKNPLQILITVLHIVL